MRRTTDDVNLAGRVVVNDDRLSEAVQALLRDRLKSFEQLEILLLMHSQPNQPWTLESVSAKVRISPVLLHEALLGLRASGLIETDGKQHRCRPTTEALAAAVAELARAFEEHRAAILGQMNANAIERIRSGSLKAFTDAFVIRKGDRDD